MRKVISASFLTILFCGLNAQAENSQDIFLKFRGIFSAVKGEQSGLPQPYTTYSKSKDVSDRKKLFSNSLGAEVSCGVFWNDFIATEITSGAHYYRQRATAIQNLQASYMNNAVLKKARDMIAIPSSFALQYHIAPYGAIRPYVGGGVHYTFLMSRSSNYHIGNATGPLLQAGMDVVFKDDACLNFDIKSYYLKSKIKYNKSFIVNEEGQDIKSRIRLDPISIGIGFGFKL